MLTIQPISKVEGGSTAEARYHFENNPFLQAAQPSPHEIQNFVTFPITAYSNVANRSGDGWRVTFEPVNLFVATLNDEEQATLVLTIALMKAELERTLGRPSTPNLAIVTGKVAMRLVELDEKINLLDRIARFNHEKIPLSTDYDRAGKREQDSEKMTMRNKDVRDIITIAILCKLLCPLFGYVIETTRKNHDTVNAESYCLGLVSRLLTGKLNATFEKVSHYVHMTMRKAIGNNNNNSYEQTKMLIMFNSSTEMVLAETLLAQFLVRNLVNVDLFDPTGDIPKCMFTVIKQGAMSKIGEMKKSSQTMQRGQNFSSGDDNRSQLEIDTTPSREKIEHRAIITTNVDPAVKRIITQGSLDRQELNEHLVSASKYTPVVPPNQFNQLFNSVLFANDFGGGSGIFLLDNVLYSRISLVVQQLAYKMGYPVIAHLMTAKATNQSKGVMSPDDYAIILGFTTSSAYHHLNDMFEMTRSGGPIKPFSYTANQLIKDLVEYNHLYNTSPAMWRRMELENANGQVIKLPQDTAQQLWGFLSDCHSLA